jgi:hypothetical protein
MLPITFSRGMVNKVGFIRVAITGVAMTESVFTFERRGIQAWLGDIAGGAKDMVRSALSEAMTWDLYKWTVLALMTAIFILVALSYGGIRAELATLKRSGADQAILNAQIAKQISDMQALPGAMQAVLARAMTDMKTGLRADIAKISAKLDAQAKAAAPARTPAPKRRAQQ